MRRLEHIGIAVKNLDESNRVFASLLGKPHYKTEEVESEGVRTSFFDIGGVKIELLEATRADSPVARFIAKRGEGIHHLAFEVEGLTGYMEEKSANGFRSIYDQPKPGADNKMVTFLHPKSTNNVLIELCEERMEAGVA